MLQVSDVVIDPALSDLSIAYKNDSYLSEILFPTVNVAKQSGKYYKFDKANLRRNKSLRAPGGKANEVGFGLSTGSFITEDHALKEKIPFEVIDQAENALNPEMDAAENVTEMLMVDKEAAIATMLTDTGTVTQNVTLSGTDQWSDFDNSDPFDDITTGINTVQAAIGKRPNTIVMGQAVFNKLILHPDVLERIKYTSGTSVTADMLARLFNVTRVLVGAAVYNSAVEGQTDALSYIWGKHVVIAYTAESPKLKQVALGFTMVYGKRVVKKWDEVDEDSRYVRVNENYAQELVAAEAAYLIKNAVA